MRSILRYSAVVCALSIAAFAQLPRPGGSGGGGGISSVSASTLTDFAVTRTSSTILTVAAGRCVAGNKNPVSVSSGTLTGDGATGSGTAFIYLLADDCTLRVTFTGTATATLSGVTSDGAGTAFPSDRGRVYEWPMTNGTWDATGTDRRAVGLVTPQQITAGTGITVSENSTTGGDTIAADTSLLLTKATAQSGAPLLCSDAGANDTYTCTMSPTLTTYTTGMIVLLKPNTNNTGAATVNIDSLGAKTIKAFDGSTLSDADLTAGRYYEITYDGTDFRMRRGDSLTLAKVSEIQSGSYVLCSDAGANDTYTCAPSPTVAAYTTGMALVFKPNTNNTGAATVNVSALGAKTIKTYDGSTLADADLTAGRYYELTYDGTDFRMRRGDTLSTGTSAFCASNLTTLCAIDEFLPTNTTPTVSVGQLSWLFSLDTGNAAPSFISGESGHDGLVRLQANAALNDAGSLRLVGNSSSNTPLGRLDNTVWSAGFLIRPNSVAGSRVNVGFYTGSACIQVYQTGGATWKAEAATASCSTGGADTGVTPADGTWTYIVFTGTGSGVNVSINGGASTAMTGSFTTGTVRPSIFIANTVGTSARTVDIDLFWFSRPVTRY